MNVDPKSLTKDQMIDLLSLKMTELCEEMARILAITSKDENQLLDGIKIASEGIRTLACNRFVEIQKEKGKS